MSRTLLWRLAALVLPLLTGLLGAFNGPGEFGSATTQAQRLAAGTQTAYGILGLTACLGLIRGDSWTRYALIAWAIPLAVTGGIAPVVWGGASLMVGLASLAGSAAIAAAAVWLGSRAMAHSTETRVAPARR